jgi:hypothetical protein
MSEHRDLRDPTALGELYLEMRGLGVDIDRATRMTVAPYMDGGHISNDPEQHHSKTPQTLGDLDDGGAT